ncbi:MAG: putative sulfate reduction protein [Algoriphagus marincola HL-49]|jgi:uncharacterized membrane protein|uniref:Putative sulfate reduction protein n=1 Tax=Algoriphagus marincola HL-49 TaxID=1305737 RepID=A0A0P7X2Z1_9BACT|nr:DUF2061 domain-containing protein [Algoriphagus formosus]KPQ09036.1 MAG: putative sulfate reduction protein [Algoriphagus marincola HL-49]
MILDQPLKKVFETKPGKDSNLKSLLKSVSWRIVGTLDTIIISFIITGQLTMALSIGSVEVISKILLYYLHERVWETATKTKTADAEKEYARS